MKALKRKFSVHFNNAVISSFFPRASNIYIKIQNFDSGKYTRNFSKHPRKSWIIKKIHKKNRMKSHYFFNSIFFGKHSENGRNPASYSINYTRWSRLRWKVVVRVRTSRGFRISSDLFERVLGPSGGLVGGPAQARSWDPLARGP